MSVCVYISMFMYRIIFVYTYGISINKSLATCFFHLTMYFVLSDLVNKNTGCLVKSEFKINNKSF